MKIRLFLIAFLLLLFCIPGFGQSWQWGQRGGSSSNGINVMPYEDVVDMDTDPNGNVYVLSIIESSGSPSVAGQPLTTYGSRDILLSSFDCEGRLRWKKVFGGWTNDRGQSVKTDALGHVYVGGRVTPPSVPANTAVHFDTDTTLPHSNVKSPFLIQYDTSGVFQWLRMPQPDTIVRTSSSLSGTLDIYVTPSGDIYWYGILNDGLLAGSGNHVIPVQAPYILRYNTQGDLLGIITLDMEADARTIFDSRITRDPLNGRFYIAGRYYSGTFTMGGQAITKPAFAGAFDAQGQFLWKKENTSTINGAFMNRPVVDEAGNIYLVGYSCHGDTFNGYQVVNSVVALPHGTPVLYKLDSQGDLVWGTNGSVNAVTTARAVMLYGNNEVAIAGSYPGRLVWDNDTLANIPNQGYDIFLARFNMQTGALIRMDSLKGSFGSDDHASNICAHRNNIYVGGRFAGQFMAGDDTLHSAGGNTDFFVARYGNEDCHCLLPQAAFNYQHTSGSNTVAFTYTGSAADSIRWAFGDGDESTAQQPSHTYADTGTYHVCVYTYNNCGADSVCQYVSVGGTSSVTDHTVATLPVVHPNPAAGHVFISNLQRETQYRLYMPTGSMAGEGICYPPQDMIDITTLPSGIYLLELKTGDNSTTRIRLVKQ